MNSKRQQILQWQQHGHITEVDKALVVTNANHRTKDWFNFNSKLILALSVIATACGIIFFFASNWAEISTFTKFALIQGLIIISLYLYTQAKSQSHASTALLFFLALLIGSLFALFGQTYQTGKDPWQLFALWTLFVTPLAFISKRSSLWVFWLALLNLTVYLFFEVRHGLLGMVFSNERNVLFYALINIISAVLFESLYRFNLLKDRMANQVAVLATMFAMTFTALYSIFELGTHGFDLIFYLAWMMAVYFYYRIKNLDILVLSSWVVSGIIFIIATIGRSIDHNLEGDTFLLLGLLTLGMSTAGGKWLLKLLKENRDRAAGEIS